MISGNKKSFENLYIRVSNTNDLAPIKNYRMLCYVIYYLSGIYAKKKDMWFAENITFKPNSINPDESQALMLKDNSTNQSFIAGNS